MYQPVHFREDRLDVQHALIRAHPFATLLSNGAEGPLATHLPVVLYADDAPLGVLRMHLARANDHWRSLHGRDALVIFQGVDSYITPTWYEAKRETGRVVPTWDYAVVHCRGAARVIEDADWLRRNVEALTQMQEQHRDQPWAVSDAPERYVTAQLKAIVGVEIPIERIDGKWKVSQNRSDADRAGVVEGLTGQGDEASLAMAALVQDRLRPPGQ